MKHIKALSVVVLVLFTGCTSLRSKIRQNISVGSSREHVTEKLGEPRGFSSQSATYTGGGDICTINFSSSQTVTDVACDVDPNYVNPLAAGLKGMADGMNQHRQNNPTCTSRPDYMGGYRTTCY